MYRIVVYCLDSKLTKPLILFKIIIQNYKNILLWTYPSSTRSPFSILTYPYCTPITVHVLHRSLVMLPSSRKQLEMLAFGNEFFTKVIHMHDPHCCHYRMRTIFPLTDVLHVIQLIGLRHFCRSPQNLFPHSPWSRLRNRCLSILIDLYDHNSKLKKNGLWFVCQHSFYPFKFTTLTSLTLRLAYQLSTYHWWRYLYGRHCWLISLSTLSMI